MEFGKMTVEELEARKVAISESLDTAENLDELEEEVRRINAELETRKANAQKKEEIRKAVSAGAGTVIEEVKGKEMPKETRNSFEYKKAYFNGVMSGDYAEARALLSTNGTNQSASLTGYVPVPEVLEREIRTAWDDAKIPSLVKRSYLKGNVRVPFELSATGANIHAEGTTRPNEEVITLGLVEIKPQSIKKWITVSDEALDLNDATLNYIYREIAQKIVEKAEEVIIETILAAPATNTSTAMAVPTLEDAPAVDTFVQAIALLSGQAKNLYIAMNRATKPLFRQAQMSAYYGFDVFEGLEDKIVYTDFLPAYGAADGGDVYAIVGDFGNGFQANFPNGNDITIKLDDQSLAEYDLVKLTGRQFVGMGIVGIKHFVTITKPSE